MGLSGLLSSVAWLFLILAVSLIQLSEYLLGHKFTIVSSLSQFLVAVMAPLVSSQTLERLKDILSWRSPSVISGTKADALYQMPVFQRNDGITLKLGYIVVRKETGVLYTIKNIMVRADLSEVTVTLSPVEVKDDKVVEMKNEEMVCPVDDVLPVKSKCVAMEVARDGMEVVARSIASCPVYVQKLVRKHQVAVVMRKEVQKFLGGFSMSGSCSLGCVDWKVDPAILGLERDTDFSFEYQVERFVEQTSHMDLLLGKEWDVRTVSGSDGYRIVLTMEVLVDANQELIMKMHATQVSAKLDPSCYRTVCLRDTTNPHTACARRLSDVTQNGTSNTAANTHGLTLAWDEFQIHSADNSPCRPSGVPSVTVSMDDMFTGTLPGFPTTSTAFASLERLLSSIPQSQLVFNSPIKEVSGEYSHLSTTSGTGFGPNTSTPADDLDENSKVGELSRTHSRTDAPDLTPQSSPSLQGHKTVEENVTKRCHPETYEEEFGESTGRTNLADEDVSRQENSATPVPLEQMRESPDGLSEDGLKAGQVSSNENNFVLTNPENEASDDSIEALASDAVKPSPNISFDEISCPEKDQLSCLGNGYLPTDLPQSKLYNENLNLVDNPNTLLSSPPKLSSLTRVQEYLQSLPSPGRRDAMPETPNSKFSQVDNNTIATEDDCNNSICSGSQSVASRQSDLSSLTGSRLGRGLFYGSAAAAGPTAPVCPFPEDWQFNTIPESIENDEDID